MKIEVQAGINFVSLLVDNRLYITGTWINKDGNEILYDTYTEIPVPLDERADEKIEQIIAQHTYIILLTTLGRLFFAGRRFVERNRNIATHISNSLFSAKFDLVVPPDANCRFAKIASGEGRVILLDTSGRLFTISDTMVAVQACLFENFAPLSFVQVLYSYGKIKPQNLESIKCTRDLLFMLEQNGKLSFMPLPQDTYRHKANRPNYQDNYLDNSEIKQIYCSKTKSQDTFQDTYRYKAYLTNYEDNYLDNSEIKQIYCSKRFMVYRNKRADFYKIDYLNLTIRKPVAKKINFLKLTCNHSIMSVIIPNKTLNNVLILFVQDDDNIHICSHIWSECHENDVTNDMQPIESLKNYQLVAAFENPLSQAAMVLSYGGQPQPQYSIKLELILKDKNNNLFTAQVGVNDKSGLINKKVEINNVKMKGFSVQNDKNFSQIDHDKTFLSRVIAICNNINDGLINKKHAIIASENNINTEDKIDWLIWIIRCQVMHGCFHEQELDIYSLDLPKLKSKTDEIQKGINQNVAFHNSWKNLIEPFINLLKNGRDPSRGGYRVGYFDPSVKPQDLLFFLQIVCYINLHHIINNPQNMATHIEIETERDKAFLKSCEDNLIAEIPSYIELDKADQPGNFFVLPMLSYLYGAQEVYEEPAKITAITAGKTGVGIASPIEKKVGDRFVPHYRFFSK
jgi:hypothetical protein